MYLSIYLSLSLYIYIYIYIYVGREMYAHIYTYVLHIVPRTDSMLFIISFMVVCYISIEYYYVFHVHIY